MHFFRFSPNIRYAAHLFKAVSKGHYHKYLIPTFKTYIPDDAVVLDIGAHAGQFAKIFSRLAPHGQVFCFEPSSYAQRILRIVLLWRRLKNTHLVPMALGDKNAPTLLAMPKKKSGGLGFGLSHLNKATDLQARFEMSYDICTMATLDSVAALLEITRVDFIKMDIEGSEMRALTGGSNLIASQRPVIYCELLPAYLKRFDSTMQDVATFFAGLEYISLRQHEESFHQEPVDKGGDYLFVPKEKLVLSKVI